LPDRAKLESAVSIAVAQQAVRLEVFTGAGGLRVWVGGLRFRHHFRPNVRRLRRKLSRESCYEHAAIDTPPPTILRILLLRFIFLSV
jgi:hypothetical protein